MEELEPRLLFSADLPGVLAQSGLFGGDLEPAPPAIVSMMDTPSVGVGIDPGERTSSQGGFSLSQPRASATQGKELVFIDAGAPNYQQLINDLMKAQAEGRPIEVVVLETGRDGIEQITEAMAERRNVSAMHIVREKPHIERIIFVTAYKIDSVIYLYVSTLSAVAHNHLPVAECPRFPQSLFIKA